MLTELTWSGWQRSGGVEFAFGGVIYADGFFGWSGSSSPENHHYGDGGLAKHTVEVVRLCESTVKTLNHNDVDMPALLTAALWHDYGKMWDYEKVEGVWRGSPHKRLIHHIPRSAIEWEKYANSEPGDLKDSFIDKVTHCILSHHGRRDWGSPIAPCSKEAWILHLCDNLSARMDDWKFDRLKQNQRQGT